VKAAWLAALALASCIARSAGVDLPPVAREPEFSMRQELRFTYAQSSGAIEAVVQSRCGVLTIVGLAPFGARVFTLVQRGGALEVTLHLPGSWPFPPENVARDVHRALLVPLPGEPPRDGRRALRYGREEVRERWEGGALVERELFPEGDLSRAGTTIVYRDGATLARPAREIHLENHARGYALEILTSEYRPLRCVEDG
jgi:hypothetical protein